MLILIGTSIVFSTLHSHHDIEWNHANHQTESGLCFTQNTNVCPISGYLFDAPLVEKPGAFELTELPIALTYYAESQRLDPFSGEPDGRSPPFYG